MKKGIVEKIVNQGWGLVRSDEGIVLLNYVLPGEEVIYKIRNRAKGILWGKLIDVTKPSKYRIEPPCPYFGECGGCIFQHITYPYQIKIKENILINDLKRIGNINTETLKTFKSPEFQYRIRAKIKADENGKIGFVKKSTNQVIPIKNCLLFLGEINRFLKKWNSMKNTPFFNQFDILWNPTNKKLYVHITPPPSKNNISTLKYFPEIEFCWKSNEENGISKLRIKEFDYNISPAVFFQTNFYQFERMLNIVENYMSKFGISIDLYSGVGFFLHILQKYSEKTIGVESNRLASYIAQKTFPEVEFYKSTVEKFFFPDADLLVMDPPRSGLSLYVRKKIIEKRYNKIIYISCNSSTFTRDIKLLLEKGYMLKDLNLLDLFPQTSHFEMISFLTHI